MEKLCNKLVPLPPIAEQKRIVARIEELLPYVDRYERAWKTLWDRNRRLPDELRILIVLITWS